MMLDPGSRPPRQLQDPRNHSYKRAMTLLFLPILFELLSNVVSEALLTRRLGSWFVLRSHQ